MSSKLAIVAFLVFLLPSQVLPQKLINGFTREFSIQGLPTTPTLKSFDINDDSVSELFEIKGSRLLVYDGKTFNLLFQDSTAPGTANLSPADVDRDGNLDLVANNGAASVIVWFGPDFANRRVYTAPVGSGVFAVRNREDGQVEFSFGFDYSYSTNSCDQFECVSQQITDGRVYRYLDTTFVVLDVLSLPGRPVALQALSVDGSETKDLMAVEYDYYSRSNRFSWVDVYWVVQRITPQPFTIARLGFHRDGGLAPCQPPYLSTYTFGQIDSDSGKEVFAYAWGLVPCGSGWSFGAYDILTRTVQWVRNDPGVLDVAALPIDLTGDGIQELLVYKHLNNPPGLYEFNASTGATLGFTEFPFNPNGFLLDLFGEPPTPRLLLDHADSLVVYRIGVPTGVREIEGGAQLPRQATIYPSIPNPFNSRTVISYSLPQSGNVEVQIVDILGRQVRRLVSAFQKAGRYQVDWNGTDEKGQSVGSGVYLAVLKTAENTSAQKIVLLK